MTLMQEAISQNALAADSLRQANECVKQAALVLEVKAGHARLDAFNAKGTMMEELIRVQSDSRNIQEKQEAILAGSSQAPPKVVIETNKCQAQYL
ncbi:hypothetical protein E4U25_008403 [Claviceps purpurea]|nr:hypothetical protein E4U25_008403 [Claviceps purpurea]